MKMRRVFSTPSIQVARLAMQSARSAGVKEDDILLVARSDIELDAVPDRRKEADTDLIPAAVRGAGYGAATGILVGLLASVVPSLGITFAGVAVAGVAGALVGSLASALMGATVPDPIRQKFEGEIQAGNILVVVSGDEMTLNAMEPALTNVGAVRLPYSSAKAAT
ncbi:hypothetical protein D3C81_404760 [compost metagenome]